MARLPPDTWGNNPWDHNPYVNIQEHAISGRMFLSVLHVAYDSEDHFHPDKEDRVKYELTEKLLRDIIQAKCVEFTRSVDPASGSYTYRARCFVTPDAQVKILRTHLPSGIK